MHRKNKLYFQYTYTYMLKQTSFQTIVAKIINLGYVILDMKFIKNNYAVHLQILNI